MDIFDKSFHTIHRCLWQKAMAHVEYVTATTAGLRKYGVCPVLQLTPRCEERDRIKVTLDSVRVVYLGPAPVQGHTPVDT